MASRAGGYYDRLRDGVHDGIGHISRHGTLGRDAGFHEPASGMGIQLVRSCTRWSHGVSTEVGRRSSTCYLLANLLALHRKRIHRSHPQQPALHLHRKPVLHHSNK
jgi:hypothetical protein